MTLVCSLRPRVRHGRRRPVVSVEPCPCAEAGAPTPRRFETPPAPPDPAGPPRHLAPAGGLVLQSAGPAPRPPDQIPDLAHARLTTRRQRRVRALGLGPGEGGRDGPRERPADAARRAGACAPVVGAIHTPPAAAAGRTGWGRGGRRRDGARSGSGQGRSARPWTCRTGAPGALGGGGPQGGDGGGWMNGGGRRNPKTGDT